MRGIDGSVCGPGPRTSLTFSESLNAVTSYFSIRLPGTEVLARAQDATYPAFGAGRALNLPSPVWSLPFLSTLSPRSPVSDTRHAQGLIDCPPWI